MIEKYNPEEWLTSTIRCLVDFTKERLDEILDADSSEIYDVVPEFPGPSLDDRTIEVPITRTIIHFELDDLNEQRLGLGPNEIEMNYDGVEFTVQPQEAGIVMMNFDVGIWTSDRSGGTTARAEARQLLSQIFMGASALQRFRTESDGGDGGIEIRRYSGGRFATDKINDVIVYRTVDGQLEVKVFSRTPIPTVTVPTIEVIGQSPGLTIPD